MLGWLKKTLSDKKKSWQQRNTSLSIDVDSIENEENSNIIKLRILNPKSNG